MKVLKLLDILEITYRGDLLVTGKHILSVFPDESDFDVRSGRCVQPDLNRVLCVVGLHVHLVGSPRAARRVRRAGGGGGGRGGGRGT